MASTASSDTHNNNSMNNNNDHPPNSDLIVIEMQEQRFKDSGPVSPMAEENDSTRGDNVQSSVNSFMDHPFLQHNYRQTQSNFSKPKSKLLDMVTFRPPTSPTTAKTTGTRRSATQGSPAVKEDDTRIRQEDSDEEDDDEALSVLEEAIMEDSMRDRHSSLADQSQKDNGLLGSTWNFIKTWMWRLIKTILLMSIFLVPSIVVDTYFSTNSRLFNTPLWRYAVMIAVVIFGHFLADVMVMILMVIIKRTPVLGTQFLYYITNIKKPLKWAVVAIFLQVAWPLVFMDTELKNNQYVYGAIDATVTCLTVTALALLFKSLFMRLLAIRFHRGAYYRRIRSSLFAEYVLTCLLLKKPQKASTMSTFLNHSISHFYPRRRSGSQAPAMSSNKEKEPVEVSKSWMERLGFKKNPREETFIFETIPVKEDELLDRPISNHKLAVYVEFLKRNSFSYTSGSFRDAIIRAYRLSKVGGNLATAMDTILSQGPNDTTADIDIEEEIQHLSYAQGARILASILFHQTKQPGKEEVDLADFARHMSLEIAVGGFALFDGNWDGSLTEKEFYTTLLSISRERRALRTALNDGELAINKLDLAITGLLFLILFICYFVIFGADPNKVLLTLSSFLLATAFAIGNTVKVLLESIIFLFVTHPFDIGDRVVVENVVYTVTKMSLLTTHLKRYDNALFYFSNSLLAQKPVLNLRRSPDQFDLVSIQISAHTRTSTLRQMEARVSEYLLRRSAHYHSKFEVEYKDVENSNRMVIRVWVQHRSNFQNMRRYRERRGKFLLFLKKVCEELHIDYELPTQRITINNNGNNNNYNNSHQGNDGGREGNDNGRGQPLVAAGGTTALHGLFQEQDFFPNGASPFQSNTDSGGEWRSSAQ